jgi:hypothetical protein
MQANGFWAKCQLLLSEGKMQKLQPQISKV